MAKIDIEVTDFERRLFEGLQNHPMTGALQLSLETLAERDITPDDKAFKRIVTEIDQKFSSVHFFRSNFGRMMNVYMQHADMDSLMAGMEDQELRAIMGDAYPQRNPKFFNFSLGRYMDIGYQAIMNYRFGTEKLPVASDWKTHMVNVNQRAVQMSQFFKDQMCRFHPYTSVTSLFPSENVGIVTYFPSLDEAISAIARDVEIYEKIGRGILTREQHLQEMEEVTYKESGLSPRRSSYDGKTYKVRYDKAPLESAQRRAQKNPGPDRWFTVEVTVDEVAKISSGQEIRRVRHASKEFSYVFDQAVINTVYNRMGPPPFHIHPIEPHS